MSLLAVFDGDPFSSFFLPSSLLSSGHYNNISNNLFALHFMLESNQTIGNLRMHFKIGVDFVDDGKWFD
jgi:hypothetical protein